MTIDRYVLAVGAITHVCTTHGVELRATPDGVVLVPSGDSFRGYVGQPAEHPAGAVVLREGGLLDED